LAAIKFGKIARNHFDKYLANLKFGDSDVLTLQSSHCQIAEDGDVQG